MPAPNDPQRELEERMARERIAASGGGAMGGGGQGNFPDMMRASPQAVGNYDFHRGADIDYGDVISNPDYETAIAGHRQTLANPPSPAERQLASIFSGIRPGIGNVGYSAPVGFK